MEQWKDRNVQRVAETLKDRMEKGYIKYGTTTERNDLNTLQWLQHLQEELLDAAVYIERLKQEYSPQLSLNLDNMNNAFNSTGDTVTVTSSLLDGGILTGNEITLNVSNYGAAMPVIGIDPTLCDQQNEFPSSFQVSPVKKSDNNA
jgi:hypothetical protein